MRAAGDACREGERQVGVRRARAALAAVHVDDVVGDGMLGLTTPDGRVTFADPRAIVAAALVESCCEMIACTSALNASVCWRLANRHGPIRRISCCITGSWRPRTRLARA